MQTKFIPILLTIFLLSACSPKSNSSIHYSPNEANLLKVIEEKDFKISGSIKNGIENEDDDRYFAFQAGYSPKQNIGISGGYFLLKPRRRFRDNSLFQMANLSAGGYYLWQPGNSYYKSKTEKNRWRSSKNKYGRFLMPFGFLFEAYGGIDLGKMKHTRRRNSSSIFSDTETSRLNLIRYFVKTGVHFQDNIFGLSLVSKFGFMDYYKGVLDIEGGSSTGLASYFDEAIMFNHGFFFEPGFNIHFGTQTIRGYFGGTIPFSFKDGLDKKEKLWNIGLVVDIDNLRRKEDTELK